MTSPAYIRAAAAISPLGSNPREVLEQLFAGTAMPGRGIAQSFSLPDGKSWPVGRIEQELPALPPGWEGYNSRNNRLLLATLKRLETPLREELKRCRPDRFACVIGTSTSGIEDAALAWTERDKSGSFPPDFDYRQHEMGSPSEFLRAWLGIKGHCLTVSTACSSAAKALGTALLLIDSGEADCILVGGCDSLSSLTVAGFAALEAASPEPCSPLSIRRRGINIGEACALFLVVRRPQGLSLLACGESSDAFHLSAPEPEGRGAEAAIRAALVQSGLSPEQISYVNLHGTATPLNDAMESKAMARVFDGRVPSSSSKNLSGHCLGAAGALEAWFLYLLLHQDRRRFLLPPQGNLGPEDLDPALASLRLPQRNEFFSCSEGPWAMASSSFAFGGSNACVILGR